MILPGFRDRKQLASNIRSLRSAAAEEATARFLARNPDWLERYGERARRFGIEDAGFHLDFLAAAIESGDVQPFLDYGEWATRMLAARHIEARFVAENFEDIGLALRSGLPESGWQIVDWFLRSGAERCLRGDVPEESAATGRLADLTGIYTQAAIGGNRQAALNLMLDAVGQGHAVIDLYAEVLQKAMYQIGTLWAGNRITVAQEHMATVITQFVVAQLYSRIEIPQTFRGRIVIAGAQGDLHQLGANMVADVLEASGFDVRFLGANVPVNAVLDAVEEHRANFLGISATILSNLPHVIRLAEAVREKAGSRVHIILGGGAIRSAPAFCGEIGASGYATDLRSAIQLINELSPIQSEGGQPDPRSR